MARAKSQLRSGTPATPLRARSGTAASAASKISGRVRFDRPHNSMTAISDSHDHAGEKPRIGIIGSGIAHRLGAVVRDSLGEGMHALALGHGRESLARRRRLVARA